MNHQFIMKLLLAIFIPWIAGWSGILAADDGPTLTELSGRHLGVASVFDERVIAENVAFVRREVADLPDDEQFLRLRNWVLPTQAHSTIRMNGVFTQTDPAPGEHQATERRRIDGGILVSPVFDLLNVAARTQRLPELLKIVEAIPPAADEEQTRARAAMLVLIGLELKQPEMASTECQNLCSLVRQDIPTGISDQWPETLVVWRAIAHFEDHAIVNDLIAYLALQRTQREVPKGIPEWHNQIASLAGQQKVLAAGEKRGGLSPETDLSQWISGSRFRAMTRGGGNPVPLWQRRENRVENVSAHDDEYLFFCIPLQGDYEVACELLAPSVARGQVMIAGQFAGPRSDRRHLEIGTFRTGGVFEPLEFELGQFGEWVHYRAAVHKDECRIFINGLLVRSFPLTGNLDPWVAIRSWGRSHGCVRDFRITGHPVVPEFVDLSGSKDLSGWIPYFDETLGRPGAAWEHINDSEYTGKIAGRRRTELAGTFSESLLRYQRPLQTGEVVDYDFFYSPGEYETHPALDRLTFIMHPDGVRLHWITDGPFDRGESSPDNLINAPEGRRSPGVLPLISNGWNHVSVSVNNSVATVHLNEQAVFEYALEPSNQRTFGFFHYADATEVQVRNVTLRGGWPNSLPAVTEQELADHLTNDLNSTLTRLESVFRHEFTTGGLPPEFFVTTDSDQQGSQTVDRDGISVVRPTSGKWSNSDIQLPFTLHGDFDVEAAFDHLQVDGNQDGCIMLDVQLNDDRQHELRLMRIRNSLRRQLVQVSLSKLQQDNTRIYTTRVQSSCEAYQGRFRIARRGNRVHFLFAENDSEAFRVIGSETVSEGPSRTSAVHLRTLGNGDGQIRVTWKNVIVRAERMTFVPAGVKPQRSLFVMNSDGTDLKAIARSAPGFTHLGSAEWSPDNRQLICDMSMGGIDTSHIIVMNADGSDMKDLGLGCMPSLSADGLHVVFSDPQAGIVRMKSDGSDRKTIERNGWGAQWSPDGQLIAWSSGNQIVLLDTRSNQRRMLLSDEQSAMLGSVYWNLGWSHDGKWIAFKARRTSGNDGMVVVANAASQREFRILYEGPNRIDEDFTWHPDNTHVVYSTRTGSGTGLKMVKINRESPTTPEQLPGQPANLDVLNCDWSPDGTKIVFSAMVPPESIEWLANSSDAKPTIPPKR